MTTYIHICLALKYEFLENVLNWYNYDPKSKLETNLAKILWNFPEKNDSGINHNKSDILALNKNTRTIKIFDTAIPRDAKISKCKNF